MRLRRRYFVGVDGAPAAGNVTKRFALRYAEGQASFGRTAVVTRFDRRGVVRVVATFPARDTWGR